MKLVDGAIRSVGITKKAPGQAPTLTEIRVFFRKHCGMKSKLASKVDKSDVDEMFKKHPKSPVGWYRGGSKKRSASFLCPVPKFQKSPKFK